MCEVYDKIFNRGVEQGLANSEKQIQQANERAEAEAKRANTAAKRANAAEEEVRRLQKLLAEKV